MGEVLLDVVDERSVSAGPSVVGLVDDSVLCERVRQGAGTAAGRAAFGELYARYREVAMAQAYRLTGCPDRAEDVVAEVFARVLRALAGGRGPYGPVLGYVMVAVRDEAVRAAEVGHRVDLVEPDALSELLDREGADVAEVVAEGDQIARAFGTLPAGARRVLWLLDVEQVPVGRVAEELGTTRGALRMLLTRCRRRLATAYLQQYVQVIGPGCLPAAGLLAEYVRGGLGVRKQGVVRRHLARCCSCREQAHGLVSLSAQFRFWVGPLIAGVMIGSGQIATLWLS